jgi:ketosteroid isomerase-like protein
MGVTTSRRIKDALELQDLDRFIGEFDTDAVWLGIRRSDGAALDCRSRNEIRSVFEDHIALGRSGHPEVIAETDDQMVVDMHPEPPNEDWPGLHHVLTFRAGKVVRMEDFADRGSALAALEPEPS